MGDGLAYPNAVAASDGGGTAHAGVVGEIRLGADGAGRNARSSAVPLPAEAPLNALTVRAVAHGNVLANHPYGGRDQPVSARAHVVQPALLLRMQCQRQVIIHPIAPARVQQLRGGIVVGVQGVVFPHPADVQRTAAEPFRQHARRAVEIELYGATLAVDIGNDHLRLPASGEGGQGIQQKVTRRDALAALLKAVDIQIDRGRQYGRVAVAAARFSIKLRIELKITCPVQPAKAHLSAPAGASGDAVAQRQRGQRVGVVPLPAGFETRVGRSTGAVFLPGMA